MPGPGSRTKHKSKGTKSKKTSIATPTPEAYIGDIDNAQTWDIIIRILCDVLDLPDLTTRSGLKKVHANFDTIYNRIDNVYKKNHNNEKIQGAVIGIYAKMCTDAILRNALFQRGLLDKLMPLLEVDSCRHLALRALGTITHNGASHFRIEISKHSSTLIKLLHDHPDDPKVAELSVTTLTHAVSAVYEGGLTPAHPKAIKSCDLLPVLNVVTETVKKPFLSLYAIGHAMDLLAMTTLHGSSAFKKCPSAVNLLVAGLKTKDWVLRSTCLGGLIRLHRHESEDDQRMLEPMKFMSAIQRGFPPHLSDPLVDYGFHRCETYLTLSTSRDFQNAMMVCAQNHDLYALGLKIVEYILRTEFSVADGMFQGLDSHGNMEVIDVGLPFTMWSDALPHCAKAIRAKNKPNEKDLADILDIKYHIMRQRIPSAVEMAKNAIERNPQNAYFYYALTLAADNEQGLRAAKKGMKCRQITPFTRFQMMQRAVEHAGDMGVRILQEAHSAGEQKWEEGIAFLMSAFEDAKTYIEQAPPDNRHMKNMIYWYILLSVIIDEGEANGHWKIIQEAMEKLKLADDFSYFIGVKPPKTNMRLTQETVCKVYPAAIKEFSDVVARASSESKDIHVPKEKLDDDLAGWLENMHVGDGEDEHMLLRSHPKVNSNHVGLYRCSWCGNPSAALRKCSKCEKARYCDSSCQKTHWNDHKKNCNSSS